MTEHICFSVFRWGRCNSKIGGQG